MAVVPEVETELGQGKHTQAGFEQGHLHINGARRDGLRRIIVKYVMVQQDDSARACGTCGGCGKTESRVELCKAVQLHS